MISAQVGDLSSHTTKYASLALTQKVFANMRREGKGFSRVDTPLFEGMLVLQQVADDVATDDIADVVTDDVADVVVEDVTEPTLPSRTPAITPLPSQELPSTSHVAPTPPSLPIAQPSLPPQQQQPSQTIKISMDLLNTLLETCTTLTRKVEALEQDKIAQALEITTLRQRVRRLDKKNKLKVSGKMHPNRGIIAEIDADEDVILEEVDAEKDAEVAEKDVAVQGRQEESQAQAYHIDLEHADKVLITAAATTITAAPSAARRRKGVVIRDPEETATPSTIVLSEPKSKDKGKGILDDMIEQVKRKDKKDNVVLRYQALKRKPQTEALARKNMMHFNSIVGFLEKSEKELEEEASRALKRKSKSSKQQAIKKQKLDEEVEELKMHLHIFPNDEDDVYTEATPLALKVPVVDYQIHTKNNKPYYKVIRADGTHQLFLSFLSLLRNFDREDLKVLWQIVQKIFASSKPKNFSDDFLLTTLKMILLVERRHPLTRFTLDQMLNNVRLEVEEKSEVSLELLRFVRRQQQEGYRPDFGVDAVEDFKEYTLRDYYCWLKTYCCWYKLKLLDNAVDSRLRLLEQSAAADDKMKK
uniref:Uncharacterized protein n=1 Tax=Tanacetum cinerariifolium TaxID=118510 RepID=A0A6L2LQ33_TANCI|nr:hypothetical protein [Tanacetum cinerariifolium]